MFKGISLLSGGLDSSVSLAIAGKKGIKVILALTFDYGQKAVRKEIKSSKSICAYLKIPHQVIRLDWFKGIIPTGGFALHKSPLIKGGKKLPSLNLADLKRDDVMSRSAKAVWVPNRNGLFINIGAVFAESLKVDYIITGFNKEEAITFPDNSIDFIRATNQALKWGTLNKVKVISFTIDMNKTGIFQTGRRLGLPIEKTWSCYEGGKTPCGKCESCIRRKRADK